MSKIFTPRSEYQVLDSLISASIHLEAARVCQALFGQTPRRSFAKHVVKTLGTALEKRVQGFSLLTAETIWI
jgi:hypothetical protein